MLLTEKYSDQISGILYCYDCIVIQGTRAAFKSFGTFGIDPVKRPPDKFEASDAT